MPDRVSKYNAFFRQLLFLAILLLIGIVMVRQLAFFIGSFLGALTLYIVFRAMTLRMVERHRWKPWLAALTVVLIIGAVLSGLGFLVFEVLAREIADIDTSQIVGLFKDSVERINIFAGFSLIPNDIIEESSVFLTKMASTIINTTYSFAANIFMMVIILYFMLAHGRRMEEKTSRYIPFRGESKTMLTTEITSIIYSNAVGIPLIMLSQGLVAAFIYWLFGFNNVVFWAFLTALCGLIPMVGTAIVSVPLGFYLIAQGFMWKGILLMLCGLLLIANVDNLFRIVLNQKISNTHPLIVIFGVILGIPLFGFWGIIFGPLLISVFMLLIKIYYTEYRLLEPEDVSPLPPPETGKTGKREQ